MKISHALVAFAILTVCGACSSKTRKAPNGFEVEVVREGQGNYAAPGEFLVMNMIYKDSKDSVWADTRKGGIPVVIMVADTAALKSEKGMESVFRVLRKGDSVKFQVTAKSLFEDTWGGQPLPPQVKPDDKITFLCGIADVTNRDGINKLQGELQAKEMERRRAAQAGQLATDTLAIDTYLTGKKIAAIKDKSGLRYVITQQGAGPKPVLSNTVRVNYKGSLMEDGKIFDQSQSPVEFPLSNLIQGWQIGFQLLSKGTKATLYIPSSLGYGENGAPPDIPANANLVFEVELIDFK